MPAPELAARWRRWSAELARGLEIAYGDDAPALGARVADVVERAWAARRPALRALDEERALRPDWFQQPDQVGYVAYADRFAGDLCGVGERVDYLRELGVTYLHLMPLLASREGQDDGGYAVSDYRRVRADLGTTGDLAALADRLHDAGMSLTLDLVLNHVAREHEWAVAARAGSAKHRAYFRTFPDRTLPDAYERTLPEVFPHLAPGSFTWDQDLEAWVWTTFNTFQWDLDWSNPDVFVEMLDVVLHLANVGVDCLRLDAVAFLWKRMGTDCQNQPEVHGIVQALRAATRVAAPATVFKAEAIVAPEMLPAYLGRGEHAGRVSDLAYHNSLMVQLWSALATADASLARHALAVPPPKPVTTAWATYVRCHDDIGWSVSDSDAAARGITGHGHRRFLARFYAGEEPGSFARGTVFAGDPDRGDARTSGTLASLAGVEAALTRDGAVRDQRALDLALGRVFLLHAAAYGWGGLPLLYMGDELGLLNDHASLDEPGHEGDNRWLHRPRMPWDVAAQRHDPTTVAGQVHAGLVHLARVRASLPSLHAAVESEVVDVGTDAVLAWRRRHAAGSLLMLHNLTPSWVRVPESALSVLGLRAPWDHLSSYAPLPDSGPKGDQPAAYALPPYAVWWLQDGLEDRPVTSGA